MNRVYKEIEKIKPRSVSDRPFDYVPQEFLRDKWVAVLVMEAMMTKYGGTIIRKRKLEKAGLLNVLNKNNLIKNNPDDERFVVWRATSEEELKILINEIDSLEKADKEVIIQLFNESNSLAGVMGGGLGILMGSFLRGLPFNGAKYIMPLPKYTRGVVQRMRRNKYVIFEIDKGVHADVFADGLFNLSLGTYIPRPMLGRKVALAEMPDEDVDLSDALNRVKQVIVFGKEEKEFQVFEGKRRVLFIEQETGDENNPEFEHLISSLTNYFNRGNQTKGIKDVLRYTDREKMPAMRLDMPMDWDILMHQDDREQWIFDHNIQIKVPLNGIELETTVEIWRLKVKGATHDIIVPLIQIPRGVSDTLYVG
ncbi:MAG: hypothetical protein KAR31_12060, partial [Candidatus Omnitrophica bacterium]|nr:hypothetical protein [Candidatus Omnitrophota bacterium]